MKPEQPAKLFGNIDSAKAAFVPERPNAACGLSKMQLFLYALLVGDIGQYAGESDWPIIGSEV